MPGGGRAGAVHGSVCNAVHQCKGQIQPCACTPPSTVCAYTTVMDGTDAGWGTQGGGKWLLSFVREGRVPEGEKY